MTVDDPMASAIGSLVGAAVDKMGIPLLGTVLQTLIGRFGVDIVHRHVDYNAMNLEAADARADARFGRFSPQTSYIKITLEDELRRLCETYDKTAVFLALKTMAETMTAPTQRPPPIPREEPPSILPIIDGTNPYDDLLQENALSPEATKRLEQVVLRLETMGGDPNATPAETPGAKR